jgi:hypothetical protein
MSQTALISESNSSGAIINNDFIYIMGLPRCGTTATQSFILHLNNKNILNGETFQNMCRYHEPVRLIDNIDSYIKDKKLIIGNVRNPLDFYISFYNFYKHSNQKHGWEAVVSKDFKDYLHHMLFEMDWSSFINDFDGYRYALQDFRLGNQIWSTNDKLNVGFFTKRYINMFFVNAFDILNNWTTEQFYTKHDSQISVNSICRQETLQNDIINLLKISSQFKMKTLNSSHKNVYKRTDYYDEESLNWVLKKDFIIFKNYYKKELDV